MAEAVTWWRLAAEQGRASAQNTGQSWPTAPGTGGCGRCDSMVCPQQWRHETKPGRLDQSRSCRFLKVATHPKIVLTVANYFIEDLPLTFSAVGRTRSSNPHQSSYNMARGLRGGRSALSSST